MLCRVARPEVLEGRAAEDLDPALRSLSTCQSIIMEIMAFRYRFRMQRRMSTAVPVHCWPLRGELRFGKRPTIRMVHGQLDKFGEAVRLEPIRRLPTGLIRRE